MVQRSYWINKIEKAWERRSVLWLSGVRRAGKTFLSRSLPGIELFDCELPRIRRLMEDPEGFLRSFRGRRIVLDEIHRLQNPSEILKIAADHYLDVHILATGSSTLSASKKFKDTLTGRKLELWLTPMNSRDSVDFGNTDLRHRFLRGGMPSNFIDEEYPEEDFQEWMDSYWAKDIQELFRLEKRASFQKFAELLLAQSGGIFDASRFSKHCEVSRTTISNYLSVLEATYVVEIITPFSSHRPTEIISAPKVYGFDTGFVCYHKGWYALRAEDLGLLWEHFVLNELNSHLQSRNLHYWRDKRGHEVDYVITRPGKNPIAIECKWSSSDFDPSGLKAFSRHYGQAELYLVAQDAEFPIKRSFGELTATIVSLSDLINILSGQYNSLVPGSEGD